MLTVYPEESVQQYNCVDCVYRGICALIYVVSPAVGVQKHNFMISFYFNKSHRVSSSIYLKVNVVVLKNY